MDKEEARFILKCFRPDGADADNSDFSEALRMAAADRELGEWLSKERAKDAEFSEALSRLTLPDGLREEILAGLAAERGDYPEKDEFDGSLIGALSQVAPPRELRGEILAAMERSVPTAPEASGARRHWWRFGVPLAAAAGIALAFVMSRPGNPPSGPSDVVSSAVPISHVEEAALSRLGTKFKLDLKEDDHKRLFQAIRTRGRACPEGCLPKGLSEVPGIGCMDLNVDGKPGVIVCFRRGEGDEVHMVVFKAGDVDGAKLPGGAPAAEQRGKWAVARWKEKGRVFLLFGEMEAEQLDELF
ncbi:hypothetical protein HAHE_04210 [Haloferula helveola]|uniref:Anti-sigma factor n=1 Tax=Haloferula helveola TaxID=490095 RepID=A0ABM7R8M0_9BACT|nr:hypothetical protein HAHE_04210 [Haloferula helveola]